MMVKYFDQCFRLRGRLIVLDDVNYDDEVKGRFV